MSLKRSRLILVDSKTGLPAKLEYVSQIDTLPPIYPKKRELTNQPREEKNFLTRSVSRRSTQESWKLVKEKLINGKLQTPQEFITSNFVLPYIERNISTQSENKLHVRHAAQELAASHRISSFQAIMDWKTKLLEFERVKIQNMKLVDDDKNHRTIRSFVSKEGFSNVNECARFVCKLLSVHHEYNKLLKKHAEMGEKNLPEPILTHQEWSAMHNIKEYLELMHGKLANDKKLINKIVKKQLLLKEREGGELRREELTTSRQIAEALIIFKEEYKKNREDVTAALNADLKKIDEEKDRKQNIFKEFVGIAAGPLIGPLAERGAGFLASLLQTAVESLNAPVKKRLVQLKIPGIGDLASVSSEIEKKANESGIGYVSDFGKDKIASKIINRSFNVEIKLQPKGTTESFAKTIDEITDGFYKNIFSEEWLTQAALVARDELMEEYNKEKIIIGKVELLKAINDKLEERINAAVSKYDQKLSEWKQKIIFMEDDCPRIPSAKVLASIFSLAYSTVGIDAFKDAENFNHELDDFFEKIKDRAGADNLLNWVRKSEWYAQVEEQVKDLGFMDNKTIDAVLGINNKLKMFAAGIRKATPGKSPKEKLIEKNTQKRVLTNIALVRIGEILKTSCGTILPEIMSPHSLAQAFVEIAKQGVTTVKFKQFWESCETTKADLMLDGFELMSQKVKLAADELEIAKKKLYESKGEVEERNAQQAYATAADKFQAAFLQPMPSEKEMKKINDLKDKKSRDYIKNLKSTAKKAAKAALIAQEKTNKMKDKLETAEKAEASVKKRYQEASLDELTKVRSAWDPAESATKTSRVLYDKAVQEEKCALILADKTAAEASIEASYSVKDVEGSWLFKVFHAIPKIANLLQTLEVRNHLSHLITFEFALQNGLADPAAQAFLNLAELKGDEFCNMLTLRSESDLVNVRFEHMMEKIEDVKEYHPNLLAPFALIKDKLLNSDIQIDLSNTVDPMRTILLTINDESKISEVQYANIIALLNQILQWNATKRPFHFVCEDKMSGIEKQRFYDFYNLINGNVSLKTDKCVQAIFHDCQSGSEAVEKFKSFFKGSPLLNYSKLFEDIIKEKYQKVMNQHLFHHRYV